MGLVHLILKRELTCSFRWDLIKQLDVVRAHKVTTTTATLSSPSSTRNHTTTTPVPLLSICLIYTEREFNRKRRRMDEEGYFCAVLMARNGNFILNNYETAKFFCKCINMWICACMCDYTLVTGIWNVWL